ncbi:MAG: arginase family protein [Anaerolineae bacterium]|nr:arginase family protein [Anaerolineae bacterium]
MAKFVCIGVPYWIGERIEDRTEVASVQMSGIAEEIGAAWVNIAPDFGAHPDPVVCVNRALAATVAAHRDGIPIIFASDCVSALGALKGLESLKPAVLWYDAHGDFNTPATTPSGFLGGMPLAALVGRGNEHLMAGVGLAPTDERDVIVTDARDLDPEEGVMLRQSRLTHLPDVSDLLTAPLPDKPLYVHLDTDVVDCAEMPAMNYPAPGGPSLAQVAATLARVTREAQVVGLLFSLWNDTLAGAHEALEGTLRLVRAFADER